MLKATHLHGLLPRLWKWGSLQHVQMAMFFVKFANVSYFNYNHLRLLPFATLVSLSYFPLCGAGHASG